MSTTEEIRDLLHMFREIGERFREFERSLKETSRETDRRFQETDRQWKETDRRFQETDRQWKETDRRFQETDQKWKETDRRFQETDRLIKESDRKLKASFEETHRLLKEQSRHYRGLTESVGFFAEGMVRSSIIPLFDQRGIYLDTVTARTEKRLNGDIMEIDLLGVGPKSVVLTEVKFKLETADVAEMLNDMQRFFTFFPNYSGHTLYGAVAGMTIDDSVARFAYRKGLFVLGQTGESIRILNDAKFVPQSFPRPRARVTRKHKRKK